MQYSGGYFTFAPRFKITDCDLEIRASAASCPVRRNAKSGGNRSVRS
jgi:hypothetical protein